MHTHPTGNNTLISVVCMTTNIQPTDVTHDQKLWRQNASQDEPLNCIYRRLTSIIKLLV